MLVHTFLIGIQLIVLNLCWSGLNKAQVLFISLLRQIVLLMEDQQTLKDNSNNIMIVWIWRIST